LYGKSRLPELLRELCHIPGIRWVRVLYCYPERITDELLDVFVEEPHMVPYLDLPIQHCDGEILKRMNRPGDEATLRKLIAHIRERVPGITLRTTLITGFPGETKEQFNRLGDFVQDMQFDRLGCFAYSEEEGTKAAEMEDQVEEDVRAHRADILMEQQAEVSAAKNAAKIGSRITVVMEGYDKYAGCYFGRSEADAPDIDGKVFVKSDNRLKLGQYITAEVFDTLDYDLLAEEVKDESAQ
jgi:ribosomal protein S12 methylthiotransferase